MNDIDPVDRLTHAETEETIDRVLLVRQLRHVTAHSPLYQEKLALVGLDRDAAECVDHLGDWPFTTKSEILEEQASHPPYGRLAVPERDLRRVHMTSGTTGRPLYIALTAADVADSMTSGRRAFLCAGLDSTDTVVHCLNYCMWAGGLTDHMALESTGAAVVPFGVGHTKRLIETMRDLRPTAISCTPSYMSRLEVVMHDEFGLSPSDLGLSKGFFGGEGGLQNPAVRNAIERTWGIRAIDANYGMADVLSIFGAECNHRQGLHFHGRGLLHPELIDPETGRTLPFDAGQEGELVLTNLTRQAQPLVRFRSGDLIRIVGTSTCACGRSSFRFLVVGRSDQMIVVQGINVFAGAVKNVLARHPEHFGGEFEIVVDHSPPIHLPLLRVEAPATPSPESEAAALLVRICREELQFTPRVQMLPFGSLPRTEGKTRYVRRTYETTSQG